MPPNSHGKYTPQVGNHRPGAFNDDNTTVLFFFFLENHINQKTITVFIRGLVHLAALLAVDNIQ